MKRKIKKVIVSVIDWSKKIVTDVINWLKCRQPGKRVGLALGVFDFCHEGHLNLLRRAASMCDFLVVGVHTDDNVVAYKGIRPANSQLERLLALEQLGIADKVEIFTDRRKLCKYYDVDVVFHGDDWNSDQYRKLWGEDIISELGIDIELIPHTPRVTSSAMRKQIPPIGWWLHCPNPDWTRTHLFYHLKELYTELGGVWIVSQHGRNVVRKYFPNAACVLVEEGLTTVEASTALSDYNLKVVITATFDYINMRPILASQNETVNLVVLSHGRSGKKGTSADIFHQLGANGKPVIDGSLVIHDWSYDPLCYTHFDIFLRNGGCFTNPIPKLDKPRVLILTTWNVNKNNQSLGLLNNDEWAKAFAKLSNRCELILAPHPLAEQQSVQRFLNVSGAQLLTTSGRSFEEVPSANCVVCDLSGVVWESMLFDTPVILAVPESGYSWPIDLLPTAAETAKVIPFVHVVDLVQTVLNLLDKRSPNQAELAALRLGTIDGKATERIVERIRQMLKKSI